MTELGVRPKNFVRGFTLTELIMVVMVIAIISAIALPRMGNDPVLLATQVDQLAGDIRYVQTLAMTQGQKYIISFPSATSYRFLDATGSPVVHPGNGSTAAITLGSGVTLATAIPAGGNALAFDGRGVPISITTPATSNGELGAQATITLTKDAESRVITITQETGRVSP